MGTNVSFRIPEDKAPAFRNLLERRFSLGDIRHEGGGFLESVYDSPEKIQRQLDGIVSVFTSDTETLSAAVRALYQVDEGSRGEIGELLRLAGIDESVLSGVAGTP